MSAVHGPIPWTAVSAAWASSAGLLVSAGRSSSPRSMAFAIALSVRIFGAESPARASFAARARRTAAWSSGSKASLSRAQIAFALAVDFLDMAGYKVYATHPAHLAVIEQHIKPIVVPGSRTAVQFARSSL